MKNYILLLLLFCMPHWICSAQIQCDEDAFEGYEVTSKGAWCWFADPRALHYESKDGSINKTYIGYIDVHGNIKAMQIDCKTNRKEEVLIRSWFQPDDHNNPTFLVLPDERVMVFYSRHTDEACFYYRVSREPGDITTLGEEKIIKTQNKTTYPSPFILSDDPKHIYLCWRGIGWHPTIARLLIPDADGNTNFDWGPYQMLQSTGARPYAKYTSNGKDKIYMTYTTGHPDNEYPNHVYFNVIDIHSLKLKDVRGKVLATIQDGPHHVNAQPEYMQAYSDAVVDYANYRNWIWEVAMNSLGKPVIAMVRISADKKKHDYYYVEWTGSEWRKTFLANAGGHFHQTPNIERCYSGGMTIDKHHDRQVYASVPVVGKYGSVYEIKKYIVHADGIVDELSVTHNSKKNNSRPYFIMGAEGDSPNLIWMYGDYYDWIVNAKRPQGYCTAIRSVVPLPREECNPMKGVVKRGKLKPNGQIKISDNSMNEFSIFLMLKNGGETLRGVKWDFGNFNYSIDQRTAKPFLIADGCYYGSSNVLGNSDAWKNNERTTNGKWLKPVIPDTLYLCITFADGILKTYINGLLDQCVSVGKVHLNGVKSCSKGLSTEFLVFDRLLLQEEIKKIKLP